MLDCIERDKQKNLLLSEVKKKKMVFGILRSPSHPLIGVRFFLRGLGSEGERESRRKKQDV